MELAAVARRLEGFDSSELKIRSSINPSGMTPAGFLHSMYRPGENVLCFSRFKSQGEALWTQTPDGEPCDLQALDAFINPDGGFGAWFLANPVSGEWNDLERLIKAHNPAGRTRRAEENLTAFRYLVLESDKADPALWIPALAQIPLPIEAVYTSGGHSVHALVRVDAENGVRWREIKSRLAPTLVELGADESAMTAVRLTRLPGCFRAEKERWQELYYLNPGADETPICELPTRNQ
ncbi:MAG: hypothetical protein ACOYM3_16505 [Terrimicrobiaceae bacterium]